MSSSHRVSKRSRDIRQALHRSNGRVGFIFPPQRGAFAIMFVPLLLVLIAMCGLALGLGLAYNRNVELTAVAKAAALAAARELNGTAAGVTAAQAKAKEAAERLMYQYGKATFTWDNAAMTFGTSSRDTDGWVDVTGASGAPANLYYVKVDTIGLSSQANDVDTMFMGIFSEALATIHLRSRAIAGRTTINVTPLGICAMDSHAGLERPNASATGSELVQYGFRRGVSYDLMQLNPNDISPVSYLVNPVVAPGWTSATFDTAAVPWFMCNGTMWVPSVTGGKVRVAQLPPVSPLAAFYVQLNSRFDDYTGNRCNPNGAPPDFNIKSYAYDVSGGAAWMNPATGSAAARSTTVRGWLETVADPPSPPPGTTADQYGPLWSSTKAVQFASYHDGANEPSGGYAMFTASDWAKLYPLPAGSSGSGPTSPGYPSSPPVPYNAGSTSSPYYKAPAAARLSLATTSRRVLNLPLLSCPIPSGGNVSATVVAIGKFFMTVPATDKSLIAEFAGVAPTSLLTGRVELFP
jgi:Flp pilus assembly protein TadG